MSEKPVLVVAGLLRDSSGRILLSRRPAGKARAGLWEFPGGKVRPGERPEEALRRELREELGIEVEVEEELGRVIYAYPEITVELILFEVKGEGVPRPLEGQEMAWFSQEEIEDLPLCPADQNLWRHLKPDPLSAKN